MASPRICLIILFCTASLVPAEHVRGTSGQTITLPCAYPVTTETTSMCWGRGKCPYSQCNDVIIWTDGRKVTQRQSERYRLLGDMAKGNVSLTIHGVTTSDTGTYCCRAEIPGIFNDIKKEITAEIQEDVVEEYATSAKTTALYNSYNKVPSLSTAIPTTAAQENGSNSPKENPEIPSSRNENMAASHIIVGVALTSAFLLSLAGLLYRYSYKRTKSAKSSALPVIGGEDNMQGRATENIYTIG